MLAIIDMDTLVYKAAGAAQRKNKETGEIELEPQEYALSNAKNLMTKILRETNCTDYEAFLTESNNSNCIRTAIFPEYKGNRKDRPRPHYYQLVRDYYINHWSAQVVSGIEADDAVSILQWSSYNRNFSDITCSPSILVGIDKDLDQVPGYHYNYDKDEKYWITEIQGLKSLHLQVMTGDPIDNIPRIKSRWIKTEFCKELEKLNNLKEIKDLIIKEIEQIYTKDKKPDKIPFIETLSSVINDLNWRLELLYLRTQVNDKIPTFEEYFNEIKV